MEKFLRATPVIDWEDPDVFSRARLLRDGLTDHREITRRCFEWVRDEVRHACDHRLAGVPVSASETLRAGGGFCFAKSHLLAGLLRANGIHAGLCYQRLSRTGTGAPYQLHGLNAVRLPGLGWYRIDARGNHGGIRSAFTPPFERLAYAVSLAGEVDFHEVWPEPLPLVLEKLRGAGSTEAFLGNPPDIAVWGDELGYAPVPPKEAGRLPQDCGDAGD